MRYRLAVSFEVDGEARFLSHHDMLRLLGRASARAQVPVKLSEGFNPHPRLSLPLPRPVGVASRCELLVAELDRPAEPEDALRRLGPTLPEGVRPLRAQAVAPGPTVQPLSARYELPLGSASAEAVEQRLAELQSQAEWPWRRAATKDAGADRALDLRLLVGELSCGGGALGFELRPAGQVWARVEEVLGLLGLDGQTDRARLVRVAVAWANLLAPAPADNT